MKPLSEDSLPYTESDNSGRDARNGRNTTASSVSCHSDPFANSGLESGVQLRNFSSPKPIMARVKSPDPSKFVSGRPSQLKSIAGNGLLVPRTNTLSVSGDDQAASEWETIAADDAFEGYPEAPARPLRRQGNFNFVYNPQDNSHPNQGLWAPHTQNFEFVSPQDPSLRLSVRAVPLSSPRLRSFHSSSSFYSDLGRNGQSGHEQDLTPQENAHTSYDPEIAQANNRSQETLKRLSRASSSDSDEDPFKYDGDKYSGFLRSSAERDVSDALHEAGLAVYSTKSVPKPVENVDEAVKVPVRREEEKNESRPDPVLDRRLTGEIATLLKSRPLTGTEGDWQTVTTEHPFDSMQQEYHDSIAKGTGSSVADVSDVTERDLHSHSYSSTDRIIRHPQCNNRFGSYRVRTDRGTNLPVSVPQYGGGPGTFAYNATRNFIQPVTRLPESAARFSNLFRREPTEQTPDCESIPLSDLPPKRGSYESLDSEAIPPENHQLTESTTPDGRKYFSWTRIRENLGREPPKTPLTIFDQPLYRRGIQEAEALKKPAHVPHDDFLSKLPRLPFPLVSLPEAAMLQQFKRQRGEEDHTESASSFVARGRSNTISTAASPGLPKTPSPPQRSFWATSPEEDVARPAPTHHAQRLRQVSRRRDSSERISDMLVSSSAILDTPPPTDPKSGTRRGWYRGLQQNFSTPRHTMPRDRGLSSSTKNRRSGRFQPGYATTDGSPFTQAETRLIDAAREEILLHRQQADMVAERGRRVFIWIMILTLFFPFIGPVVLYGKLNSTISWYTHGGMRCLTKDQHGTLKQQLIVEAVVYPALIIALSVYYSVRK
ncbi:hypothetical protein NW762_000229 [Fusarium torreyae]|uniref:Uncharacterized protein n=1 Tax=Fusarium torreyae TaxID=1237075 RepID=A0A9W8SGT8_9HYPO|nr:hypothetical protein NW762_000229 [Fusarium torreyae]